MATAIKQFDNYVPEDSLERTVIGAMFHVTDLPFDNADAAFEATGFPKLNDDATMFAINFPGALCASRRIIRRIDQNNVMAAAFFVRRNTFSYGPQPYGVWESGQPDDVPVPVFTRRVTGFGNIAWHVKQIVHVRRPVTVRVLRRIAAGGDQQAEQYASIIDSNIGKLYTTSTSPAFGRTYRLDGYRMTRYPNNQIIIDYRFETNAQLLAIPIGALLGLDVAIPALNHLDGYLPVVQNGQAPTVVPMTSGTIFALGGPLPGA